MPNLEQYTGILATMAVDPKIKLEIEASMNYWVDANWKEVLTAMTVGTRIRIKTPTIMINGIECPQPKPGTARIDFNESVIAICCGNFAMKELRFDSRADAQKVYKAIVAPFGETK